MPDASAAPLLRRHAELLLLAAWLLLGPAWHPLLQPDEGRYAEVAYEMLGGSPLVPLLHGLPFFHKPPLLYWLDAAALALFGATPFAARMGPALMAWLLGAGMFLHLRRWHGLPAARAGLLVLATSLLFFVGAEYVNHDMGVAACITLAVLSFVQAMQGPAAAQQRWLLAGWALCGLGVLAKGLIGVVLPLGVLLPWLAAQRRWGDLRALAGWRGLLAGAAVALPWMALMAWRYPGFLDYFIVEQHFRRYAGVQFNNVQPVWFFWLVVPLLMLPWSLWLWPALRHRGALPGLYLWWAAWVLLFFSLPASKLVGYAMPALAPLAALLGLALAQRPLAIRRAGAAAVALCLGALVLLAWKAPRTDEQLAQALRARWQPGDRVVLVDTAFYDLRILSQLGQPPVVVSDWDDPQLRQHDTWRKELADAARFDPAAGSALLWTWQRAAQLRCLPGVSWLVAPASTLPRLAGLQPETVFSVRDMLLLRVVGGQCDAGAGVAPAAPAAAAR